MLKRKGHRSSNYKQSSSVIPFPLIVFFLTFTPFSWPQDNSLLRLSLFPPWAYPMRFPSSFLAFLLALGIGPSLGQQEASLDQQGSNRLSLFGKPTVSIPQVTVPQFDGISIGGISAVEIEDRRGAIYWWNDTVAPQLTSLLSKMVTATGDISVRETDNSKYTLLAEVTSYKETKEETKGGGGRVFIFGARRGSGKVESAITMNIRIIDTETQEVKREATIRGVAQAEVKRGGGSVNLGIVSFQGDQSNKEVDPPIEEAVQNTKETLENQVPGQA